MEKQLLSRWNAARCGMSLSGCCVLLILVFSAGCGDSKASTSGKFVPPVSFSDEGVNWVKGADGMTEADNQRIGQFFDSNPDLLASPDWNGQPEKYVVERSSNRIRYYWFGGNIESPTWNVVEFEGRSFREFEGQGLLGM